MLESRQINVMVRFFLEVAAYASMASWGWALTDTGMRFVLGPGVAIVAAVIWGTFAVTDDPTRSRKPPVPVPGPVRLAIETVFFVIAVGLLYAMEMSTFAILLAVVAIGHYIAARDRVKWLLQAGPADEPSND